MKARTDFKEFYELLEKKENFLLTSHQDPDGDSIGSLIGLNYFLKDLGKKTVVYSQGRLPNKYEFLDPAGDIWFTSQPVEFIPEAAIVLECPNIDRVGFVKDFITSDMILVNIDHHNRNSLFGDINYIDESACAVAEILYHIIKLGGYKITPEIAEAFYAGIASDTGRFKFSNTDAKCFKAVSELVEAGANPKQISDKIFSSFSAGTIMLLGGILKNLKLYNNGSICVLTLTNDDLERNKVQAEDTEGIIDYSLIIQGVKVGIMFKEIDMQTVKIGLRSQNSIDISVYARQKGGGGHPNAAGFTLNKPLDEAVTQTIAEVTEFLNG